MAVGSQPPALDAGADVLLPRLADRPTTAPALGQITRAEWRWLAWAGLALLALFAVPYAVWLLAGPPALVHVGTFWYPRDFTVYLAAMQQGAQSASWLIYDRFTPEPHNPAFMFPLYVALGKLARLSGAPVLAVYYAAEVAGRVVLLAALYAFAAAFLSSVAQRRLALALMLMGTNLGFWGALLLAPFQPGDAEGLALGASLELVTLGVFLAPLHLMLGLACTLLSVVAFAAAAQPGASGRAYLALAGAVLGLALVHPFNLPVVVGVFGVYAVLQGVRTRRWPWPAVLACLLAGAVALPFLAYNYYTFRIEPFWRVVYGEQNDVPSPAPPRLLLDYGLVLLGAPLAVLAWRRTGRQPGPVAPLAARGASRLAGALAALSARHWLALLWVGLLLAALYAPVPFQRRLAYGLQPGLAVLAAAGLAWSAARLAPRARRWLGWGLVAIALPTAAFLYVGMALSAATNHPVQVYVAGRDEWWAGEWLAARMAPDEVVLASEESGFWLAALVPGRVFLGHKGITYDVPAKRAVVAEVLAAPPAHAARLLAQHGVRYLYYGPRERAQGALAPAPGLARVYQSPTVEVFRVE